MSDVKTLRAWVENRMDTGCICPVCDQTVRRYRRSINGEMARTLVLLAHLRSTHPETRWWHIDRYIADNNLKIYSRNMPILRFWGLVKRRKKVPGGNHNGFWRITNSGVAFAEGRMSVPSHALIYNDICTGLDGDAVSIRDVLGSKFSFAHAIGGAK